MLKTKQKFILFSLSEAIYALGLDDAYRIFELQSLSSVPHANQRIAGLTYYDGHLVTVLATSKILGLTKHQRAKQALLVKYENHYYAYLVNQAHDIVKAVLQKNKTHHFIILDKQKIPVLQTQSLLKEIFDHE